MPAWYFRIPAGVARLDTAAADELQADDITRPPT
jgi:hypothetical protein